MKKFILLLSLVFLILMVTITHAKMTPYSSDGYDRYIVEVQIEKGWNLILFPGPTFYDSGGKINRILEDSQIYTNNIKAGFFYFPNMNSYGQFYPNDEEFMEYSNKISNLEAASLGISSAWIFSDKQGVLKYSRVSIPNEVTLFSGWNFITITQDMAGKSLNNLKNDCTILKSAMWTPSIQNWDVLSDDEFLSGEFSSEMAGLGLVIKTQNTCTLKTVSSVYTPPTLP